MRSHLHIVLLGNIGAGIDNTLPFTDQAIYCTLLFILQLIIVSLQLRVLLLRSVQLLLQSLHLRVVSSESLRAPSQLKVRELQRPQKGGWWGPVHAMRLHSLGPSAAQSADRHHY